MPVTHPFVSAITDGADATLVRPSNWNATHKGAVEAINVKTDYGAVGDDTADDTNAFVNALSALPAGGGMVYAPAGTYKITSSLDLVLLKSLVGAGRYATTLHYTGSAHAINIGVPGQTVAPLACGNRLADLRITGPLYTTAGSIGIRIAKCLFPAIESVAVENIETGIRLDGSDLWIASGHIDHVTMQEVKFGMLFTANAGKQVNDMSVIGGWIGGAAAAPANAYGVKLEASCDTNKFYGTATETFLGTGSKGFWVTSGAAIGHRFFGTRTEACTTFFLLDSTSSHNLVVGNSEPVTDNGAANQVIEMVQFRRSTRYMAYAATITPDAADGEVKEIDVLTGAMTINNPTNPKHGQSLTFLFKQDATGGRVVTWGTAYRPAWTPSTAANLRNSITFVYNANYALWIMTGAAVGMAA